MHGPSHGPSSLGPLSPPPSKEKVQDQVKLSPWSAIDGRSTDQKAFDALTSSHCLAFSWTSPLPHDPRSYKLVVMSFITLYPTSSSPTAFLTFTQIFKNLLKNDIEASNARFCSYKFVEKQKKPLASKESHLHIHHLCLQSSSGP